MSTYSSHSGVARVTVNRDTKSAPSRQAPATATPKGKGSAADQVTQAALASHTARIKRGPAPAPTSEQYRAASVSKAAEAKQAAYHAAYYHGHAVAQEALKAAAALRWGRPTAVAGSGPTRDNLPMTFHFAGGQRAVVGVTGVLTLHP